VNLDLASTFDFGNETALKTFFFDHRVVHEETATALTNTYGGAFSTFGIASPIAEGQWLEAMRSRKGPMLPALQDWLRFHAQIHNTTYMRLAGTGTLAPDLSIVDFSKEDQFYDWIYVHQEMHDFEQDTLGIT
jgi:hypothetical protein